MDNRQNTNKNRRIKTFVMDFVMFRLHVAGLRNSSGHELTSRVANHMQHHYSRQVMKNVISEVQAILDRTLGYTVTGNDFGSGK